MSDINDKITINLTPRAAAFLDALVVAHEARRKDERKAHENRKAEQLKALAESRQPDNFGHPAFTGPPTPPMTREEIAEQAFERGLASILHVVTQDPNALYGAHHAGIGRVF